MAQKSLIARLFDIVSERLDEKSPEEQVRAHIDAVNGAFRTELSGFVAAALFAKKSLDTSRQVEMPFPDAYVSGEAPIDDAARTTLIAYVGELEKFQAALLKRDTAVSLAVAKGLTTWIVTFYAMIIPGLLPLARQLWARLDQGYEGVEDAHKFLLRRAPSDVERTYFNYRPTFLMPPVN
jgi:hypothetical protein